MRADIRKNVVSNRPIKMPTRTEMAMTITVNLIVSARVGHVVLFSSAITSRTNFTGDAMVGAFGVSIIVT